MTDDRPPSRAGLFVSYSGLAIAAGAAALLLILVAVVSYRSGAEDEKNQLLAERTQTPPTKPADDHTPDPAETVGGTARVPEQPNSRDAGNDATSSGGSALPVLGEDPRERGHNYLVVATLFRQDATAAAQFLTDSGVPCVVVAPEGKSPDSLLQDRRSNWLVVARQGFSTEEYKLPSSQTRRADLERRVKQIGRRWKQDKKGSTDFADSFWDKFGK